ncbi:hypothetical protein HQ563_12155 [bacterium]|nr:hypothetical protein [bacterium]
MKRLIVAVACMGFLASVAPTPAGAVEDWAASPTVTPRRLRATTTPDTVSQPPHLPPVPAAPVGDRQQVLVELDLFRVRGNIVGETWLNSNTSATKVGESPLPRKGQSCVFTFAELMIAGVKFRSDDSGWTWDGEKQPTRGKKVEMIASPRILVLLNESFKIAIGSQQPIEYFEKRPDGLFELKRLDEETGFTVSGRVEKGKAAQMILCDLTILLRSVDRREPIKGVTLDVGQPIITTHESKTKIAVRSGQDCGIFLGTEGYGDLLMRLRVDLVNPGK